VPSSSPSQSLRIPKKLYVKGLANIAVYVLLAPIALLTIAIAAIRTGRPGLLRRIGIFKY